MFRKMQQLQCEDWNFLSQERSYWKKNLLKIYKITGSKEEYREWLLTISNTESQQAHKEMMI